MHLIRFRGVVFRRGGLGRVLMLVVMRRRAMVGGGVVSFWFKEFAADIEFVERGRDGQSHCEAFIFRSED